MDRTCRVWVIDDDRSIRCVITSYSIHYTKLYEIPYNLPPDQQSTSLMSTQRKAAALISGGLDSLLAARVMQEQGIHVEGINFYTRNNFV